MSIHLESASRGFGLKMEIYSKIASTDITVRTEVDNSEYLDKILSGKVGFKSKNMLRNFQEQGMMYFSNPSGFVQIRFVGEFKQNDIRKFVNAINKEYHLLTNPQSFKTTNMNKNNNKKNINQLRMEEELKKLKMDQEKKEQERLRLQRQIEEEHKRFAQKQKKLNEEKERRRKEKEIKEKLLREEKIQIEKEKKIKDQIKYEQEQIRKLQKEENSNRFLLEKRKLEEIELSRKKLEDKFNQNLLRENKIKEEKALEKIKEKEKELKLKEKYESGDVEKELIILENNSNSLIISSNLVDKSIIEKVLDENYLGFSSRDELKKFQNKGDIKIDKNIEGTYDFIFVGDYNQEEAQTFVNNITEEYSLIIQEKTYLKVLEKIKENNMSLESEIIDKENSIVLTLNL